MKTYNEYMNKISVSDGLHQKLVSHATNPRPVHRPVMIKRYAAASSCLAIVMLGIFIILQLMQHNVTSIPRNKQSVSQPGASNEYKLVFNKIKGQLASDIYIPGHFWQKLASSEIEAIFPTLAQKYSISAIANFQSGENDASLFNIDAYPVSASGIKSYIQIAPGKVIVDYMFDSKTKTSDVFGKKVKAGYFETKPNSKGRSNITYFASLKLSEIDYYVELGGAETEKEKLKDEISELIGLLIKGGAANINVFHPIVVPELREDRLSLDEARADADFGKYIPASVPNGFIFEDALRFINQEQNELIINWVKGMGYIDWRIYYLSDKDKVRITSVGDKVNYDLSFYPIPRANSIPDKLREVVDNPIFLIDELTLDAVRARAYKVSDSGDEPGYRMNFCVLYGDILVDLRVKGASAEAIFNILQQIKE